MDSTISTIEIPSGNCINCHREVHTPYCPQCGQPFPPQRMSISHLVADFHGRPYGARGIFFRTVKDLTLKPGEVIRAYIEGNRVLYNRPIGYFFLMITIMLILAAVLGVDYVEFLKGSSPEVRSNGGSAAEFNRFIFEFISRNIKLLSFIIIPFQALIARYLFFRKSGYSYLEHTVLPFYIEGHVNIITMLGLVFFRISEIYTPFWLMMISSIGYFGYAYTGFITNQSKLKAFLKGIGIFLVSQFLLGVVSTFIGITYVMRHPEIIEMLRKK